MLNRTNRTLSANLNRLNLGTRSLVLDTNECNGKQTLRARHAHAHGFAMRAGMFMSSDPSMQTLSIRIGIPAIPGSSPVRPRPVPGLVVRPTVAVPATAPYSHDCRPFDSDQSGCWRANQSQPQAQTQQERAKHGCKPLQGLKLGRGKAKGCDAADATRAAAAPIAAAAG
jgi:hypothetical protein